MVFENIGDQFGQRELVFFRDLFEGFFECSGNPRGDRLAGFGRGHLGGMSEGAFHAVKDSSFQGDLSTLFRVCIGIEFVLTTFQFVV